MGWLILAGAAIFAVVVVACYRLMLSMTARAIEVRHRAMEEILATGRPPGSWLGRWRPRMAAGQSQPSAVQKARRSCLRRLDVLISYARRSRLLDDEQTRTALLGQLESLRRAWDEADWASFLREEPRDSDEGRGRTG